MGYLKTKLGKEQRRKLRKQDSYGFKKLQAEELLVRSLSSEKLLSLRLADVIGPYDETFRFWKQLIWAQNQAKFPLEVLSGKERRLSFVFSRDVVGVIVYALA
jgi:nucleoside-diphosphate-sugar epimerase